MSSPNVWTPSQPEPVGKEIVLENPRTHECFFVLDGEFARIMQSRGLVRHEINSAADYDRWCKKILQQAKDKNEEEDYVHACIIDARRKELRDQLHARLLIADNREREIITATLNALEVIRQRKERVRPDSFFLRQGFEDTKSDAAEQVVTDIITNKNA